MNSGNSQTFDSQRLLFNLSDKTNLNTNDKHVAFSIPTRNHKFELPDRSYSVSGIQDYFECILKIHGEKTDNLSIRIYVNEIENRITFSYYRQLLMPETM